MQMQPGIDRRVQAIDVLCASAHQRSGRTRGAGAVDPDAPDHAPIRRLLGGVEAPCARAAQLDASTHGGVALARKRQKLTSQQYPDGSFRNPVPRGGSIHRLKRNSLDPSQKSSVRRPDARVPRGL